MEESSDRHEEVEVTADQRRRDRQSRLFDLFKNVAYVFAAFAFINLVLQILAHISSNQPPLGIVQIITGHLSLIVTAMFFVAFAEFVQHVKDHSSDE